ncbi:MAG TPA: DNA-3-methyladenine glycosylase [Prolixibacteraceae bacterium]|nr:DNA-3-methyladenine glycosylase [Prolixibacteraceae bacterium]
MADQRLGKEFFLGDAVEVAQNLIGKTVVRRFDNGQELRCIITETEAYRGEDDLACHASKGRTPRTDVMYHSGGVVYVYLIYGMYWMLNFVTSEQDFPAAVLIRGLGGINGPGRVGKTLQLDRSFYGENLCSSSRIWVDNEGNSPIISSSTRIGIDYAGLWAKKPWRFIIIE